MGKFYRHLAIFSSHTTLFLHLYLKKSQSHNLSLSLSFSFSHTTYPLASPFSKTSLTYQPTRIHFLYLGRRSLPSHSEINFESESNVMKLHLHKTRWQHKFEVLKNLQSYICIIVFAPCKYICTNSFA